MGTAGHNDENEYRVYRNIMPQTGNARGLRTVHIQSSKHGMSGLKRI
jgi:uncharacterized protein (DUF488 family)